MSWLSSSLKKIGHVAEKAAPFVGLIPGVGTIAGGAIGGLGALAAGDGLKGALKYGAEGALSGYGGSKLLGGKGILGLGGGLKKIGGALGIGGAPAAEGASQGGGLGGLISGAGGLISKIGGVNGLLGGGALGYGAYQQKQAGDMREKALKLLTDDYASRAPLRSAGLSGMLNETPPDLSSTFAGTADNPFSKLRRVA